MTHAAPISLGWFSVCLRAASVEQTVSWYRALGFTVVDGKAEHGYQVLASGPTTITVMSFLQANLLCFRGANVDALARELGGRGLTIYHQGGSDPTSPTAKIPGPRRYDPSAWPAEFHTDERGEVLTVDGAGDFVIDDPDGHTLYFDSVPVERVRYDAGERYGSAEQTGDYEPRQPRLGRFVPQLRVEDLAASRAFYERLGLAVARSMPERGYVELSNDTPIPLTIALDSNDPSGDVLGFDCEDLEAVAAWAEAGGLRFETPPTSLPDGASVATLRDPEGNLVRFRQAPGG